MVNIYKVKSEEEKDLEKKVLKLKKIIKILKKQNKKINDLNKIIKEMSIDLTKMKNPRCSDCGSWNVIKRGFRPTIDRGKIQKYHCKDCNWKFTHKTIDYRMRHNRGTINRILQLRKQGKTYSQIADEIGDVMSRQSVMRIINKLQKPEKDIIIKRKQHNQYGEYEREFKIKI